MSRHRHDRDGLPYPGHKRDRRAPLRIVSAENSAPTGFCVQPLATRTHTADMFVPSAVRNVTARCLRFDSLSQPEKLAPELRHVVYGTNRKWYIAAAANCHRDRSTNKSSIMSPTSAGQRSPPLTRPHARLREPDGSVDRDQRTYGARKPDPHHDQHVDRPSQVGKPLAGTAGPATLVSHMPVRRARRQSIVGNKRDRHTQRGTPSWPMLASVPSMRR